MTFFDGKSVMITGAVGFIGSHLSRALAGTAKRVIAVDKKSEIEHPHSLLFVGPERSRVEFHQLDVTDQEATRAFVKDVKPEVVFHLAAQAHAREAFKKESNTAETNIMGTFNMLEATCAAGRTVVQAFVFASTDKVYGQSDQLPLREHFPLQAVGPYDASKAAADLMVAEYARRYKMPIATTRCCNVYGPGDLNWDRGVPNMSYRIVKHENPCLYDTGANHVRDFMHVDDAVSAYLTLAENISKARGQAYNFGWSQPVSLRSLAERLLAVAGDAANGLQVGIRTQAGPRGVQIESQWVDSTKAREDLGWTPKVTLDTGLRSTFNWYANYFREHPDLLERAL